ncbi:MAG: chlorophyllide reductase subunit [Pseudomonadota bacterium]|jgi:chlorophyllide a reductase subunit Y
MSTRTIPIKALAPQVDAPVGCHAPDSTMAEAAKQAGKSSQLEQYARDYPRGEGQGPHDQPQSMCPAFGSLRVGLRMRRTATILSGSACCVYGLTFTSHFYGARRSVGYVPFNSETLVTGKLFEDIRDAVIAQANPEHVDAVVVINLCVPTASGVPLQLLPKEINGVRIIGIDVPGFGVPTHAEAKDVLTAAMLDYARAEVRQGPVPSPKDQRREKPTLTLVGEMFPADPVSVAQLIAPMGLGVGAVLPTREWRELYVALDGSAVAAIHPFYTASLRSLSSVGKPIVGSAPVGIEGTQDWLLSVGDAMGISKALVDKARNAVLAPMRAMLDDQRIHGRITLSGYEGSELLVARLLIDCGADVRYVGSACPSTPWNAQDIEWLKSRGVHVQMRATLEQDLQAMHEHRPDLVIGTTPVVQRAKELSLPALYFTNLISARPLLGVPGMSSLVDVVRAAMANADRMDRMAGFFDGVST